MKIRSLLTVVAMFSVLLFASVAFAYLGVDDAVPGRDTVVPIICKVDNPADPNSGAITGSGASQGMDTLWAIADTSAGSVSGAIPGFNNAPVGSVVCETLNVKDIHSATIKDFTQCWTHYDVVTDACSLIINGLGATRPALGTGEKQSLRVKKGADGVYASDVTGDFFMGYVEYVGQAVPSTCPRVSGGVTFFDAPCPPSDRFVSWGYLTDLNKGFASGFMPFSVELGRGAELTEANGLNPISAAKFFPRYLYLPSPPAQSPSAAGTDTFNWWMVLAGRQEYNLLGLGVNTKRSLVCTICNEEEVCASNKKIPIPYEFNVIDVFNYVNGLANADGHFAGFGLCDITESGTVNVAGCPSTGSEVINGTRDLGNACLNIAPAGNTTGVYTMIGWTYEREFVTSSALSWDVMHEMPKLYCAALAAPEIGTYAGTNNPQTEGSCTTSPIH